MRNVNKSNTDLLKVLQDKNIRTKISIYMSYQGTGDDFDPYEKNYVLTQLNPKTIVGYIREVTPERLVYRQYGLHHMGALEVLTDSKYRSMFEHSAKIVINDIDYQVFREATGGKHVILKRPYNIIRVVLVRKD